MYGRLSSVGKHGNDKAHPHKHVHPTLPTKQNPLPFLDGNLCFKMYLKIVKKTLPYILSEENLKMIGLYNFYDSGSAVLKEPCTKIVNASLCAT